MDPRTNMIVQLKAAGYEDAEVARRMGAEVEEIEAVLGRPEVAEAVERAPGEDDGSELFSGEQIKFFVEKMFPKALKVIDIVLTNPGQVTPVQWKATEWVLGKAAAIQELTKDSEHGLMVNNYYFNERAAGALEKLAAEWGGAKWVEELEAGLKELPPGVE